MTVEHIASAIDKFDTPLLGRIKYMRCGLLWSMISASVSLLVSQSVSLLLGRAVQKRMNGLTFCLQWRLPVAQETFY